MSIGVQNTSGWRGVIDAYREQLPVSEATPVVTLLEGNTGAWAFVGPGATRGRLFEKKQEKCLQNSATSKNITFLLGCRN